jgi:hypothetical protein
VAVLAAHEGQVDVVLVDGLEEVVGNEEGLGLGGRVGGQVVESAGEVPEDFGVRLVDELVGVACQALLNKT